MSDLQNLKFRVASPEQSERLQNVLFGLGYDWHCHNDETVKYTDKPHLYTYNNGLMMHSDDLEHFVKQGNKLQDAKSFIEAHTERQSLNEENMKAAVAATEKPFSGLEDAYNSPSENIFTTPFEELTLTGRTDKSFITEDGWKVNTGVMPVDKDAIVDVDMIGYGVQEKALAGNWRWETSTLRGGIIKWRFQRPEDAEFYKQPKTVPKERIVQSVCGIPIYEGTPPQGLIDLLAPPTIDAHYSFTYTLTQADIDAGSLKIDPYFVSKQWKLGSKDDTGIIFHTLKTLARFGDKNTKEREIIALYKQVVRLAQIEGVAL